MLICIWVQVIKLNTVMKSLLQTIPPKPYPSLAITAVILASILSGATTQDLVVLPTNSQINTLSNYTLMLNYFTYTVPAGATLALTFPPQYSPTTLNNQGPYSGYDPTLGDFAYPPIAFTQAVPAGNTLLISGLFTENINSGNPLMMQLTLFNITNPNSLNPGQFIMTIYQGNTIYYPTGAGSSVSTPTFTVSYMPYSTQVFTSSIWETSVLRITVTPNTLIDTMQLNFPSVWINETVSTNVKLGTITCSSSTHPTLTCTLVGLFFQVTNLYYAKAGDPIAIDIHSIYNPTSIVGVGQIYAYGLYLGTQLTTATISLPANSFSNDILRQITVSTTQQATTFSATISFSVPHISMNTDTYTLTFPSELTLPPNSQFTITGPYTATTPSISNPSSSSISFQPFSTTYISKASLTITMNNIARPRQCTTLSQFVLATYRMGSYLMEFSPCCAITLADRQTLLSSGLSLSSSNRLTSPVTYSFNFTTNHINLRTTDKLSIIFPPDYSQQITTANTALCPTITISSATNNSTLQAPTCSITLNSIVLSSFLTADRTGSDTFIVAVASLSNPSATPGTFQLSTLSANGHTLETIKGITTSITANILTSFTVTPSSYTTNNANTLYTFGIGNNAPVSNGYTLVIQFPSDIPNIHYNTMQCTLAGVSTPCSRLNSTYGTTTHSVLLSVNATTNNISTVTISSVVNPASTAQTGPFLANIIDLQGNTVESSTNQPTVMMNSTSQFLAVIVNSYNTSAGLTTLEQMVTMLSTLAAVEVMLITPFDLQYGNSTLTLTISNTSFIDASGSSCASPQFSTACALATVGNNLVITFSSIAFTTNTNFLHLFVNSVKISNSKDLTITAALTINGYSALATTTATKVGQMYAQPITAYTIVQNNYLLGQLADITLQMTINNNATAHTVDIFIPPQYTTSNYQLTFNFTQLPFTFTANNPTVAQSAPFLFLVKDSLGHTIGYSQPNGTQGFTLACSLPCQTCSTNLSHCLSCYTSINWIKEIYLQSSTSTCVSTCSQQEYLSNGSCLACSSGCLTCLTYGNSSFGDGSGTTCLSCLSNEYLLNSTCFSVCPNGYYPSPPICTPCMSNCLTCSNYSFCSACAPSYYFLSGLCLTVCPQSYLVVVSGNSSICQSCPSSCLVCSSVSTCTTCGSGYYLSSGQCVTSCVAPLLPNYLNQCSACECSSCSVTSYNCTACGGVLALLNYQCLLQCPEGYYSSSNVCLPCLTNCSSCTSASLCSICSLPNVLYYTSSSSSSCLTACPSGTIATINPSNFSYLCSPCDSICLGCSVRTDLCTSCSAPLLLSNGNCTSSCPAGQFSFGNQCLTCYPQCKRCSSADPTICYSCSSNYFLSGTACLSACPNGTYANIATLTCSACSNLCSSCLNSSHCTGCTSGYFLYLNLCYSSCSAIDSNYYSYNGQCLYCQRECASCYASSPYECVSCSDASYYYNPITRACTAACLAPYYTNANQCALCSSPCATCDVTFDACLTCLSNLVAFKGTCLVACPQSYKNQSGTCTACSSDCLVCNTLKCTTCQPYAYLYHNICVLDCSLYPDLPITVNNYCTNCEEVPQCQQCSSSPGIGFTCFLCVYPYVVFNGECLNACPTYYQPDAQLVCQQTAAYALAQQQVYEENKPKLPPFSWLCLLMVSAAVLVPCARKRYQYTYHQGYLLALAALIDLLALLYSVYYITSFYEGDYSLNNKSTPLLIIAAAFAIKVILTLVFLVRVVWSCYLDDIRYQEWRQANPAAFISMVLVALVVGPRWHKLYYSKLWERAGLSYRIVSVQKFYLEDVVNWWLLLPDILDVSALILICYNIFITYAVLYLVPFEVIAIKAIIWVLFFNDLKKPDRGFFIGDEEQAQKDIKLEQEAAEKKQRQFEMENLAKLIRCQSAGHLRHQKLYDFLFWDETRSAYDPNDYEDPPKVPKKKIAKYIERGRFRKGKKISMEQKLRRFAESIKPAPKPRTDDAYLKNLIYWKPPKFMHVKQQMKEPKETEESMLNLLRDKEIEYEAELKEVEIQDLEDQVLRDSHRKNKGHRLVFQLEEETIGNQTFYEPTSIEHLEPEEYDYFDDRMNRNYARRQHLPHRTNFHSFDDQELRVLRHSPLKKRVNRSRMNDLSIRRG